MNRHILARKAHAFRRSICQAPCSGSEKKAIRAFKRAKKGTAAYNEIYNGIDASSMADFQQKVPIVDKDKLFTKYKLKELCVKGFDGLRSILLSSGHSGKFSYAAVDEREMEMTKKTLDLFLEMYFEISRRSTYLINFNPMGVRVDTELPSTDTSVRSDSVIALIRQIKDDFEQIILVGDPNYLKKIVEDGKDAGLDWKSLNVFFIIGGEWFSESFREYIASIVGENKHFATFGISELGLSLFQETAECIRIRKAAQKDKKLRNALFGQVDAAPFIFNYLPSRIFLESLPENNMDSELVFTILGSSKIPLIRYNSHDCGMIITNERMKELLQRHGYHELMPEFKLPFVAVGNRRSESTSARISANDIKQAIYRDHEVAEAITGNFVIQGKKVKFQLKKGKKKTILRKIEKAIQRKLKAEVYLYHDFPYNTGVDYERKFQHILK